MPTTRRNFLKTAATVSAMPFLTGSAAALADTVKEAADGGRLHIAANQYTCANLFGRDGKHFMDCLAELKAAGIDGVEPTISTAAEAEDFARRLGDAGLEMRSLYTGPNFYTDDAAVTQELARMTELAEKAKTFGTRVIVCNSAAKSGKSDEEIRRQSAAYEKYGCVLQDLGMKLGMHYHTTEWEFGGREFLHLMATTDPASVGFCFDTHWSYRASGNSTAAVEAHMHMYAARTVEFHFRQSVDTVWSESFGDGDIDHAQIAAYYRKLYGDDLPHMVLEQAAENGTPHTLAAPEIFRRSAEYIRKLFA